MVPFASASIETLAVEEREVTRGPGARVTTPKNPARPFNKVFEDLLDSRFDTYIGRTFPIK